MKLRALALTATAACTLGLAACGGDSSTSGAGSSDVDAKTLLSKTFGPSDVPKIKSGKFELAVGGKLTGSTSGSGDASATLLLNEAKDGEVPDFQADVAVKGESGSQKVDMTAGGTYVGGRFYVSYDGENYDLGEEISKRATDSVKRSLEQAQQQAGNEKQSGDVVAQLGLQPDTWLTDPKVDGEESIGGADTYKITGAVDIKAMVPDVLDAARKAQTLGGSATKTQKVPEVTDADLDKAAKQIKQLDVAIWTGKDDYILRKLEVKTVIDGDKKGDQLDGSISLTLSDVNEQQDIKAPSDTKPVTDLMPKLSGLFGALSGAGGLSGSGSGSGSLGSGGGAAGGANSQISKEFLDCVNSAAGDPQKLNACQSKLNP